MNRIRARRFGLLGMSAAASAVLLTGTAMAAIFPDVPDGDPHQANIEWLVGLKVIGGNPDGTFAPNREVNRAEFLAMVYRAMDRKPDTAPRHLFKDVEIGAWYQLIVDDAAAHGYVQGYSDNTFRPAQSVNRVEALKLLTAVMGFQVPELTNDSREIVRFGDVHIGAWYVKYLYFAYANGILPVPGQDGNLFYPDRALLRKEAASYIANALRLLHYGEVSQKASSASAAAQSTTSQAASAPSVSIEDVSIPFTKNDTFSGKQPKVFRFSLTDTTTIDIDSSLKSNGAGLTCNLFKIEKDGYAYEFYVGYRSDKNCSMVVALGKGDYQMQVQSVDGGGEYTVKAEKTVGDKNDGFTQAVKLSKTTPRVGSVDVGDYMDFYEFTVAAPTNMRVDLSAAAQLNCSIWPMAGVELESFSGPTCNTDFDFPTGTYIVGIGHAISGETKQTYTLRLK